MKIMNYIIRYRYLTSDSLGEQGNKTDPISRGILSLILHFVIHYETLNKSVYFSGFLITSPKRKEHKAI